VSDYVAMSAAGSLLQPGRGTAGSEPTPFGWEPRAWKQFRGRLERIADRAHLDRPELARRLGRLRLRANDPELHELVQLAGLPLPVLDDDQATTNRRAVAAASLDAVEALERLVLPEDVLAEIAAHAASVADGFESLGRLVVDEGGHALRYHRLENHATEPHKFKLRASWRREPGERSVIVHSHPAPGSPTPSQRDLERAAPGWLDAYAVFHCASGQLGVFRIATDRQSFTRIPLELAPPANPLEEIAAAAAPRLGSGIYAVDADGSTRRLSPRAEASLNRKLRSDATRRRPARRGPLRRGFTINLRAGTVEDRNGLPVRGVRVAANGALVAAPRS
jgi:proteasome lid subunit RPN8/RPN11